MSNMMSQAGAVASGPVHLPTLMWAIIGVVGLFVVYHFTLGRH